MQPLATILAVTCLVISCHAGAQTPSPGPRSDGSTAPGRATPPPAATSEANADEPVDLQRQILWHPEHSGEAIFIPEVLFQEHDLSELPLTPQQRSDLESWIDKHRNPARYYAPVYVARGAPFCSEPMFSPRQGLSEDARPLPDLVREASLAFVGQVAAVVPGKDYVLLGVGRLIYVEVKELLVVADDAKASAPRVGESVAVLKEGGSLKVGGVTLCEKSRPGFDHPEVGDWLLVVGAPPPAGSPFMRDASTFPIENGEVLPQPYRRLQKDETPRSVRSLLEGGL
jgi:hypothetical protein